MRWGTIKPTKPMIPATATEAEAAREAAPKSLSLTLRVSTPKVSADLKPRVMILRSVAEVKEISKAGTKKTNTNKESVQVRAWKDPNNQKMMELTCSPARYLMKEIPADKIADIMTPASIRLVGESLLSLSEAKLITTNRVRAEKINAPRAGEKGLVKKGIVGIVGERIMITEAPKAAPEDTPKV
jgi:hypothetical protein